MRVRHVEGDLGGEACDRARSGQHVNVSAAGVRSDGLPDQRTAPAAIGQQPPPEVSAFPRSPEGPPGTPHWREVQEHDGVRGLKPDVDDVVRAEVSVHDPRIVRDEFALDSCPLVTRCRSEAGPPEELVQFDHRQASDRAQVGGESRFAGRAWTQDDHTLHICLWCQLDGIPPGTTGLWPLPPGQPAFATVDEPPSELDTFPLIAAMTIARP